MGDIVGWRVVRLATRGDIGNVSALVVPVRAGMAEHGRQYRMWPDDDLERARQFAREQLEANRILAEALRESTRANREVTQLVRHIVDNGRLPVPLKPDDALTEKKRPVPEIVAWRVWRSFVEDLQRLEREWRVNNRGRFPKLVVAEQRACDVATVTRAMVETHGLKATDWPPLTWDLDHSPLDAETTQGDF